MRHAAHRPSCRLPRPFDAARGGRRRDGRRLALLVTALWFLVVQPRISWTARPGPIHRAIPRGCRPAWLPASAPEPAAVGSILRPDEANKVFDARLTSSACVSASARTWWSQGMLVGLKTTAAPATVRFLNFGNDYRTSLSLVFMQADIRRDATRRPPAHLRGQKRCAPRASSPSGRARCA